MATIEILRYPMYVDWERCKTLALSTVWKKRVVNQPDERWKHGMLFARHSPIRTLPFTIRCYPVKYWVSTHFARHKHLEPYISTQRNDRQDMYDRNKAPQDAPVIMTLDLYAEELMTVANKRLCMKADADARKLMGEIRDAVIEVFPEAGDFLVPFCIEYGCHETNPCPLFEQNLERHIQRLRDRGHTK